MEFIDVSVNIHEISIDKKKLNAKRWIMKKIQSICKDLNVYIKT